VEWPRCERPRCQFGDLFLQTAIWLARANKENGLIEVISNRLMTDTLNLICHFFRHYRSGVMGSLEIKGN
jgi:hypothetical protein